jgi:hypothetical protein
METPDADIVRLGELHAEMDRAIPACYGWQDLSPQRGFYQNDHGQARFTVSPEALRELLKRLLELTLAVAIAERAHSIANEGKLNYNCEYKCTRGDSRCDHGSSNNLSR